MGKIEKWLKKYDSWGIIKGEFTSLIREGKPLRDLQNYLFKKSNGLLEVSGKTIKRYIKTLPKEVQDKRFDNLPKSSFNLPSLKKKITKFFFNPDLAVQKECEHLKTVRGFNTDTEEIETLCLDCKKVIASYPIERGERQDRNKNLAIYESLRRKKR